MANQECDCLEVGEMSRNFSRGLFDFPDNTAVAARLICIAICLEIHGAFLRFFQRYIGADLYVIQPNLSRYEWSY